MKVTKTLADVCKDTFNVSFQEPCKDADLSLTTCSFTKDIRFKIHEVSCTRTGGEVTLKTEGDELVKCISSLEEVVISKLAESSTSIFNKEFPLEKFQKSIQSAVTCSGDSVKCSFNEECSMLLTSDYIKIALQEYSGDGSVVVQISGVTFVANKFYLNFKLLSFVESEPEPEVEQEQVPEEPVVPDSPKEEENFF